MASSDPPAASAKRKDVAEDAAPRKPRILLAACGSVAAVKFGVLCNCFSGWADIKAIGTKASLRFIDGGSLPKDMFVIAEDHEWQFWKKLGDRVLHIELCKWADIMVIAPLSANTLAKVIKTDHKKLADFVSSSLLSHMIKKKKKSYYVLNQLACLRLAYLYNFHMSTVLIYNYQK